MSSSKLVSSTLRLASSLPTPCSVAPSPSSPPPSLTASKINFQLEQQVPRHLGPLAASAGCKQLSLRPLSQPLNFSAIPSLVFPPLSSLKGEGRVESRPSHSSSEGSSSPAPSIPAVSLYVGFQGPKPCWPGRQTEAMATSLPAGKEGCVNWQEEHGVGAGGAAPGSQRCTVHSPATMEAARRQPGDHA